MSLIKHAQQTWIATLVNEFRISWHLLTPYQKLEYILDVEYLEILDPLIGLWVQYIPGFEQWWRYELHAITLFKTHIANTIHTRRILPLLPTPASHFHLSSFVGVHPQ